MYLLDGTEDYLKKLYLDMFKDILIDKATSAFNYNVLNNDNFSGELFYELVNSISMFSTPKVIILDDINFSKIEDKEIELILSSINDIPENTHIFIKQTENLFFPEKKKKLKKSLQSIVAAIENNGIVAVLNERNQSGLFNFIVKTINSKNKKIRPENVRLIIEKVGTSMNSLSNEVEKLISYSDDEITKENIEVLCTVNIETTAFYLVNDLTAGKIKSALLKVSYLIDYMHVDGILVNGAIISSFCDIYRVKVALQSKRNIYDLSKIFPEDYKNREFKLRNSEKIARKYSTKQIKEILNLLLQADEKLKSFNFSTKLVFEKLILKIGLINA